MKNSKFADHIANALNEYLQAVQMQQVRSNEYYEFSMKIHFDFEDEKVKSISISDVDFKALNKSINKKLRQL